MQLAEDSVRFLRDSIMMDVSNPMKTNGKGILLGI
jgi:hypothetical protein